MFVLLEYCYWWREVDYWNEEVIMFVVEFCIYIFHRYYDCKGLWYTTPSEQYQNPIGKS